MDEEEEEEAEEEAEEEEEEASEEKPAGRKQDYEEKLVSSQDNTIINPFLSPAKCHPWHPSVHPSACLRVYPLDMPRTPYRASEGKRSQ